MRRAKDAVDAVGSFCSKSRLHSRGKYQDRVLYGTDLGYGPKGDLDSMRDWESTYMRDGNVFQQHR